jgi:hypothetical protein
MVLPGNDDGVGNGSACTPRVAVVMNRWKMSAGSDPPVMGRPRTLSIFLKLPSG